MRLGLLGAGATALAACGSPQEKIVEVEKVVKETVIVEKAAEPAAVMSLWSEFASPPEGPTMDSIVTEFNEANPTTLIKHTRFEDIPFETAIKAAYAGGQPPDMTEINGGADMWQYAEAGELLDLTELITPMLPNMLPAAPIDITYKGKLWAIPFADWIGNLIFTNTKILEDNQIDEDSLKTWGGFMEACEKLKGAGITPIAFGNKEAWNGDHWISHLMSRMYGERGFEAVHMRTVDPTIETDLKFTDEAGVKAWQYYLDLLDKGYFSPGYLSDDYPAAYTYFLQGNAAFFQTGGWFIGAARDEAPDFPLDFILFPEVEGFPGKAESVVSGGLNLVISKRSELPEEAKKFLTYWSTEEPNRIWAEETTGLPFFKFDTSSWNIDPLAQKEIERMQAAPAATKFNDHLMNFDIVVEHVWNASQGILSKDLTPEEAAENMEMATQKWIEDNK